MFKPDPWQSPTQDGYQRPVSTMVNVKLPAGGNETDNGILMKVAQDVVSYNAAAIHRFMAGSRAQASLSDNPYMARSIALEGLNARWEINQGSERLIIDVYPASPSGGNQLIKDTNLDGYCCWIHGDPGYPDKINNKPQFPGPYNIFFNGYLIEENYQPKGPIGGYPILFGPTALQCASYIDTENTLGIYNPLLKDKTLKHPGLIVPLNGWGSTDAGTSPDGVFQKKTNITLGYWIFDFVNVLNPASYFNTSFGGSPSDWRQFMTSEFGATPLQSYNPVFDKGLLFLDPSKDKSPLLPMLRNGFSVALSPAAPAASEVPILDIFIAEFYDRGKYRIVSQSWNYSVKQMPKRNVAINDNPLFYGAANLTNGFTNGGGFLFNLDPTFTKNKPDGTDTLMGPHMGMELGSGSDNLAGLSDSQKEVYNNWAAAVHKAAADFRAQLAIQLAAISDQIGKAYPLYQNAYKLAIQMRAMLANTKAYEDIFPDYDVYYAPKDGIQITYTTPAQDPNLQLVLVNVIVTQSFFQSDGSYINVEVSNTSTYGPTQTYYMDFTPDLGTFIHNLQRPTRLLPYYGVVPGSQYDNIVGTLPPETTETSGQTYAPITTYDFLNVPPPPVTVPPTPPDPPTYLGPGSYGDLMAAANTYILKNGKTYSDLITQYQKLAGSLPPDAPPLPHLGDSYEKFGYKPITISGDTWKFGN